MAKKNGRTGPWSKAKKAMAKATREKRKAERLKAMGEKPAANTQDALAYLLKAEAAIIAKYRRGNKRVELSETLTMLALHALRGEL
jgi:hypothetical protein